MVTDDVALLWGEYAKTRSNELRNQLIEAHWHLVEATIARFDARRSRWYDPHTIAEAAEQAILQAVEQYVPGRGPFKALFAVAFESRLVDSLRRQRAEKRRVECLRSRPTPEARPDAPFDLPVSPRAMLLLRLRFEGGLTLREMGQVLGCSKDSANLQLASATKEARQIFSQFRIR